MRTTLNRIADSSGHIRGLTIDQRSSLKRLLGPVLGVATESLCDDDLFRVKTPILQELADLASCVILDKTFCEKSAAGDLPRELAIVLTAEKTGYVPAGKRGRERRGQLDVSETDLRRLSADGVKLIVYFHPDVSNATQKHQLELARRVGDVCHELDLVFVLEPLTYPVHADETRDRATWEQRRPEIVLEAVSLFSQPQFGADVLKLEFPASLDFTEGIGPDNTPKRFDVAAIEEYCGRLNSACPLPWTIMSEGAGIDVFAEQLQFSAGSGACGFFCGRAIWKDCLPYYRDPDKLRRFLRESCVSNFQRLSEVLTAAPAWSRSGTRLGQTHAIET